MTKHTIVAGDEVQETRQSPKVGRRHTTHGKQTNRKPRCDLTDWASERQTKASAKDEATRKENLKVEPVTSASVKGLVNPFLGLKYNRFVSHETGCRKA